MQFVHAWTKESYSWLSTCLQNACFCLCRVYLFQWQNFIALLSFLVCAQHPAAEASFLPQQQNAISTASSEANYITRAITPPLTSLRRKEISIIVIYKHRVFPSYTNAAPVLCSSPSLFLSLDVEEAKTAKRPSGFKHSLKCNWAYFERPVTKFKAL